MKNCGTCGRWGKPETDMNSFRPCGWQAPRDMPFWASIYEGDDHGDWTMPEQGVGCRAWIAEDERL